MVNKNAMGDLVGALAKPILKQVFVLAPELLAINEAF